MLAATIGVWLFYVQHQFENTRWAHEAEWSLPEAALHGSSYYDLPIVLRWFSANIGVHHVHHLSSRIPFYRLREVLRDYPELGKISRVTLVAKSALRELHAVGRGRAAADLVRRLAQAIAGEPHGGVSGEAQSAFQTDIAEVATPTRLISHSSSTPLAAFTRRRTSSPSASMSAAVARAAVDEEVAVQRRDLGVADDASRGSRRRRSTARPCVPAGS